MALLALVIGGGRAGALPLTGGPTQAPPGGVTCTSSELAGNGTGMTLHCTIGNPAAFADLYFGLNNTAATNGMDMDGTLPSGNEIFRYSSSTPRSITYTSGTTIHNVLGGSAENVNNRLVLTLTSGDGVVMDTGGAPANNANGDIQKLFRIAGNAFTVRIEVSANHLAFPAFGLANTNVFDLIHKPAGSGSSVEVNLGFYYNACSP
jgi:hypothetical protein